jgi:GH43 family beta-xylosidase
VEVKVTEVLSKVILTVVGGKIDTEVHVAWCIITKDHRMYAEMECTNTNDTDTPTTASTTITVASTFVNPIAEGADPWVIRESPKRYLWCMSEGNRAIAIHTSSRLTCLGEKHIVWRAPSNGPVSQEVWAPELHFLDNHWHIYFAASNGENENHRSYVLRSKGTDPLGLYDLHGPLPTGDGQDGQSPNIWAIDMTVLQFENKRYAIWSGWDAPGSDRQYLYIAQMKSTTELLPPRVRLCENDDHLWERIEPNESYRGLNEGPQVFQNNGSTFIVYSCGASWLNTYKLGLFELIGDNPLDPTAWKKHSDPVFEGNGVGHSCFVKTLDGTELWHVYHAKRDDKPGWRRVIHVQPMQVSDRGMPLFGSPIKTGIELECPKGETFSMIKLPYRDGSLADWSYFGHHQFYKLSDNGALHLGIIPENPINDYRSGEKVILNRLLPTDYSVGVNIVFGEDIEQDNVQAGILLRCSRFSLGYASHNGYYAGLIPKKQVVIFGKMDGTKFVELDRASFKHRCLEVSQRLQVDVSGHEFAVSHEGRTVLRIADDSYHNGFVGLRTVDSHATFNGFCIQAATWS